MIIYITNKLTTLPGTEVLKLLHNTEENEKKHTSSELLHSTKFNSKDTPIAYSYSRVKKSRGYLCKKGLGLTKVDSNIPLIRNPRSDCTTVLFFSNFTGKHFTSRLLILQTNVIGASILPSQISQFLQISPCCPRRSPCLTHFQDTKKITQLCKKYQRQ